MNAKLVAVGAAVMVVLGVGALSAQQAPGAGVQQLYAANCAACHGATGTPDAAMARSMGIPDFATMPTPADSVWLRAITSGKGRMPAYGTRLQPPQVRQLVTYLKSMHRR